MVGNVCDIRPSFFFHANIIKYCNRPFADVDEMNAELARLWNASIAKDDTVWYVGDFAFYKKNPDGVERLFKRLNGRKTLIRGSHDQGMENLPWDLIIEGYFVYDDVVLVHEGDAFLRAHPGPENKKRPVFCGHVHQVWQMRGNLMNVGVDTWHFRPIEWGVAKAYWQSRWDYYVAHGTDA